MRISFLLLALCLFATTSFCQITFEKGYFITAQGQRTECEIKNRDWKNNPTEFEYKTDSEIKTMPIEGVKEFGIDGKVKFVIEKVAIDRSSSNPNYLSATRNPEYDTLTVALNVVVDGLASLYNFETMNTSRFFYKTQTGKITPLIYKKYTTNSRDVKENNDFQQQLFTTVNCGNVSAEQIKKLRFKKDDLESYFINFNKCSNSESKTFSSKSKSNVQIRPAVGLGVTTMEYTYSKMYSPLKMKNNFTYRVGAEVEVVLPFNNNKWSIAADLYYQSMTSDGNFDNPDKDEFSAEYSSIDLMIGPRHYFFLTDRTKIFLNAMLLVSKPVVYELAYAPTNSIPFYEPSLNVKVGYAVGAGVSLGKLNTELRFVPGTSSTNEGVVGRTTFTRLMLVVSYPIN